MQVWLPGYSYTGDVDEKPDDAHRHLLNHQTNEANTAKLTESSEVSSFPNFKHIVKVEEFPRKTFEYESNQYLASGSEMDTPVQAPTATGEVLGNITREPDPLVSGDSGLPTPYYGSLPSDDFIEHLHSSGEWSCDCCQYKTQSKGAMLVHYRRHTGNKPFKCTFCNYSSTNYPNLRRHIKRHTGVRPYGCPFCDHRGIEKKAVYSHMLNRHQDKQFDVSAVVKYT